MIYPCANLKCKWCDRDYLICKKREKALTCPDRLIEYEGTIFTMQEYMRNKE